MKYLIFGNGYLGNKFNKVLKNSIIDLAKINDEQAVKKSIEKYNPEVVINCAGRAGSPNIDWCENHKLETLDSNLRGPLTLLKVCREMNQYWVQLGSGCIYQGDNNGNGWSEDDLPNFIGSYYSKTKATLNNILADFPVLQLRLRMPIDNQPGPRNLINKITNYKKVISIPNSVTVVDDLIIAMKTLIDKKAIGIYNIVNPGAITHEEILNQYKKIVDPAHTYEIISLEELAKIAKAPRSNCILSTKKLEAEGIYLPPIHERIIEVLQEYKKYLRKI